MPQEPYGKGLWGTPSAPAVHAIFRPVYGGPPYEGPALVDTGSSCCLVPQSFADKAGWH
jgi:predicted aspartyl protease